MSASRALPSLHFELSLGVTFPLNLLLGIPFYRELARRVLSWVLSSERGSVHFFGKRPPLLTQSSRLLNSVNFLVCS